MDDSIDFGRRRGGMDGGDLPRSKPRSGAGPNGDWNWATE